jgi:hypothetical protein
LTIVISPARLQGSLKIPKGEDMLNFHPIQKLTHTVVSMLVGGLLVAVAGAILYGLMPLIGIPVMVLGCLSVLVGIVLVPLAFQEDF